MNTRQELYKQLLANVLGLKNGLMHAAQAKGDSLHPGQKAVLFVIDKHGSASVKHLANKLCVSSGAATQHLDALVEAGLVTRQTDLADRRSVVISLSDVGRAKLKEMMKTRLELVEKLFDDVSDAELEQFVNQVEKLQEKVKQLG